MNDDDEKTRKPDRVDRKLTEIGSSLSDLLRNIRERRMTLRQIRDELDAVRAQHEVTDGRGEKAALPDVAAASPSTAGESNTPDETDPPAED
jgi:hypothetical protein